VQLSCGPRHRGRGYKLNLIMRRFYVSRTDDTRWEAYMCSRGIKVPARTRLMYRLGSRVYEWFRSAVFDYRS
jgi:hypothetical protein